MAKIETVLQLLIISWEKLSLTHVLRKLCRNGATKELALFLCSIRQDTL